MKKGRQDRIAETLTFIEKKSRYEYLFLRAFKGGKI